MHLILYNAILFIFIYLFGWLIPNNLSTDWFLFMPFKKQAMQIKKVRCKCTTSLWQFMRRSEILHNGFYLTLYVGLWKVLKDDLQFEADPLTIRILCIALEMNMALQHLGGCYYASINWHHLFSLTLIIIPFSRLQFRQPFGNAWFSRPLFPFKMRANCENLLLLNEQIWPVKSQRASSTSIWSKMMCSASQLKACGGFYISTSNRWTIDC